MPLCDPYQSFPALSQVEPLQPHYHFEHLNRTENLELLFVHESDGVEHKEKVRGLLLGHKSKPMKLDEPKTRIRETEVLHDCKFKIKERKWRRNWPTSSTPSSSSSLRASTRLRSTCSTSPSCLRCPLSRLCCSWCWCWSPWACSTSSSTAVASRRGTSSGSGRV